MSTHEKNNKILTGRMKNISKMLGKYYTVKLGITANSNKPVSDNMDLAGIGAVQEYGATIKITKKMAAYLHFRAKELGLPAKTSGQSGDGYVHIPARSWLYEPIKSPEFRKLIYDWVGDEEIFKEYADKDVMRELAEIIGNAGLWKIQEAFNNGGINGEWPANSPFTIASKGSSKPLIDNGDFRKQISFEVEENA